MERICLPYLLLYSFGLVRADNNLLNNSFCFLNFFGGRGQDGRRRDIWTDKQTLLRKYDFILLCLFLVLDIEIPAPKDLLF